MDLHVIIVIACVFLASLFSILFINKFFKSKTYEEAAAEKKALVEKLYPSSTKTNKKLPRKLITKKESKKEKKRQQKQQHHRETTATENDSNDSDNPSFDSQSVESSPAHSNNHKKLHVEFTEPEIIERIDEITHQSTNNRRITETKSQNTTTNVVPIVATPTPTPIPNTGTTLNNKQQKRKGGANNNMNTNNKQSISSATSGILINKTEHSLIKEQLIAEPLNHFENKPPKDMIELKKVQHESGGTGSNGEIVKINIKNLQNTNQKKSIKPQHKNNNNIPSDLLDGLIIPKEMKQLDEKFFKNNNSTSSTTESPKITHGHHNNNKSKNNNNNNNNKKKDKELSSLIDKLTNDSHSTEVIGVNCLMTLFSRAELNRNDIQILIDYLLNKQQDSVIVTHTEWSDDIIQKLRKQLNDKEKALQDEQIASVGLQGKLRDLRTEINMERAQFNINNKAYVEDILNKQSEIQNLNQELQNLHEKFQIERQQFQTKLRLEKQTNSQEFITQIQQLTDCNNLLKNDLHQKTIIVNDLQLVVNASRQLVEEHNKKCNEFKQKIHILEQHCNDFDNIQLNERQKYELELTKLIDNEKELHKVEIRNLQNELDSIKSELNLKQNELLDSKSNIENFTKQIKEMELNFCIVNKNFRNSLTDSKQAMTAKELVVAEYETRLKNMKIKEDELLKIINEQKEKNNELRMKNWKLIDALKNAETTVNHKLSSTDTTSTNIKNINNLVTPVVAAVDDAASVPLTTSTISTEDLQIQQENIMRELLQRLYPNETQSIKELSIDDFIEYIKNAQKSKVITTTSATTATNTTTEGTVLLNNSFEKINNEHYNLNNNTSHNHNNINNTKINNNNSSSNNNDNNNINNNSSSSNNNSTNNIDTRTLLLQNSQLRTRTDELTKIVTKTENMLTHLETQAREQDAYWRGIVQSQQDEINSLKTSPPNGEAI